MRVQQHGAGPDCWFGKGGSGVLREYISQCDAIMRECVKIGCEVNLRVVRADVVRPHRIDHEKKYIGPQRRSRLQVLHQLQFGSRLSIANIGVLPHDAAEITTGRLSRVTQNVVRHGK